LTLAAKEVELHLYDLHPEQRRIRAEAKRFNVWAAGRRTGKTTLSEDLVVETLLDDRAPFALFAPNYPTLTKNWRDLRDLLAPVTRKASESEHRLEVVGGGELECWSLDNERVADSARGRKYKRVGVEEAGSVERLLDHWQKVIRPMLTDLKGDAWIWGTPKGMNDFWVLWQRGQDDGYDDWASWRTPSAANPHLDPSEVEANRRDLSEQAFAQEFLAEFLSDGSGVFRGVDEAATASRQLVPRPGHRYAMGVDWGKLNDFTVISVVDCTTGEQVHLERFNQIDYHFQSARLAIAVQTFKPQLILAEQNSIGEVQLERLGRMGFPVHGWVATNASKSALVESLSLVLERRQLRVLPDPVQLAELRAYAAERLPSGLVRYGAPGGMHDDCVVALGLSVLAASTHTKEVKKVRIAG
jgi:hypothetical protein